MTTEKHLARTGVGPWPSLNSQLLVTEKQLVNSLPRELGEVGCINSYWVE